MIKEVFKIKNNKTARSGDSVRFSCEYPNRCPMCNDSILPNNIIEYANYEIKYLSIMFECPSCGKSFITEYKFSGNYLSRQGFDYEELDMIGSYPNNFIPKIFDNRINDLSPQFCDIYNQSLKAELNQMSDISGMGFRKSLEFLIKDYCIKKNSSIKEEDIKGLPLSQVIENYVESDKIKKLAKASSWIGNDETHYIRKWSNKNVDDLKKFIESIVAYITYDISVDEANEMIEQLDKKEQ